MPKVLAFLPPILEELFLSFKRMLTWNFKYRKGKGSFKEQLGEEKEEDEKEKGGEKHDEEKEKRQEERERHSEQLAHHLKATSKDKQPQEQRPQPHPQQTTPETFLDVWADASSDYNQSSLTPPSPLRRCISLLFLSLYGMFPGQLLSFLRNQCSESRTFFFVLRPLIENLPLNPYLLLVSKKRVSFFFVCFFCFLLSPFL